MEPVVRPDVVQTTGNHQQSHALPFGTPEPKEALQPDLPTSGVVEQLFGRELFTITDSMGRTRGPSNDHHALGGGLESVASLNTIAVRRLPFVV